MNIDHIVSQAASISQNEGEPPILTFCSGIEGLKEVYKDTLNLEKDEVIYSFLNPSKVHPDIYSWLTTEYVAERVKKGIFAHVFLSVTDENPETKNYVEKNKVELRETHYVHDFGYPFEGEVIIYGSKVALINFNPNDSTVGIIVHDNMISQTIKAFYLHYLWKMI